MAKEESIEFSEQLGKLISEKILKQPKRKLETSDKLISSGLIDSFHLVDLALFIEEKFNVRIDDAELNKDTFDTLDQLAALVQERQA